MKCENVFCIYQKDGICLLGDIELDISGTCVSCILTKIPQELLTELKEQTLYDLNK